MSSTVFAPRSLEEAVSILGEHPDLLVVCPANVTQCCPKKNKTDGKVMPVMVRMCDCLTCVIQESWAGMSVT